MTATVEFASIDCNDRPLSIEYCRVGSADEDSPLMVFLHEGLGSLAIWKDFPARLCDAAGCRGLVYSRPGYGRSTPRASGERWDADFMHRQATEVLPRLFEALNIDAAANPPWLFGHSDGASIALIYAARFPAELAGAIVLAPHIMVEELTVASIVKARQAYRETDLKDRLGRYHDDPDSAFGGWNDIWLKPEFRDWNIESELDDIRCPLLAVQGLDDEYGTLEQVRGIARRVAHAQVVELPDCGHSPQRDQARRLIELGAGFIAAQTTADRRPRTVCGGG